MKAVIIAIVAALVLVSAQDELDVKDGVDAPECSSVLSAVYKKSNCAGQACSFIHMKQQTNSQALPVLYVNPKLTICNDTKPGQFGFPQTAINFQNRTFYFYSGTANYVYGLSTTQGRATPIGTMPEFPTNITIGLEYTNGSVFLIATDAVYLVANGAVVPIQFIKFLDIEPTSVTVSHKGIIYVLATDRIWRLEPLADTSSQVALQTLRKIRFARYRAATNTILVVDSDSLYSLNIANGVSTLILALPPGIRAMTLVDKTVYVADATKLYTVDLTKSKIIKSANFDSTPLFGSFQYVG
jgi:hypothetical protein